MKTFVKATISADAAARIVAAARQRAIELGIAISVAVVDDAGELKSMLRMDGSPPSAAELAQNKAYTAASFSLPTDQWYDLIKDNGALLNGIPHISRMVIFGGGYPIMDDGKLIGGVGVSGGYADQDGDIAGAGLAAIG